MAKYCGYYTELHFCFLNRAGTYRYRQNQKIRKRYRELGVWTYRTYLSTSKSIKPPSPFGKFLGVMYGTKRSVIVISCIEIVLVYLATYLIFFSSKSNYGWVLLSLMLVLFYLRGQLRDIKRYKSKRELIYLALGSIISLLMAPLSFLLVLLVSPVLWAIFLLVLLIQSFGKMALCYSQFVLKILAGENKMRTAIILVGIVLFVFGSIFQLIAAF